ncbi:hypothetical protein ACAG25_07610 [Mycobacterium sp. pV006]|uniref:hypothetical protein n=1 Tax=Mycobacterium sp. pV006 TaxID=3238983 RepID=UPI00351B27E8
MHPHSERLSELFSSRLTVPADDDVAGIVLGPRLPGLCRALGVPERDWWTIARLTDRLAEPATLDALGAYVDVLIAERCRQPGDDLISDLIAYHVDGQDLTADEIRELVVDLIAF